MIRNRKETAWKKNRRFSDFHGGRMRLKCTDGIFKRYHDLLPPAEGEEKPVFFIENTSKDFYYPVTVDEIKETLEKLPKEHVETITHVWLDKVKTKDYLTGETLQGEYICGSGVYLIKLYAVPKDNKMRFGQKKPTNKQLSFYKSYCMDLRHDKKGWYLQWTSEKMKQYFLERLLLHEIGHCVDFIYNRHFSKANRKQLEDFADSYAMVWGNSIRKLFP
ncbi:hypothetical protein [Bacteroides sp. 519]|uniref:hypothetical protein n=1 Tax=Bacteroides sp. 519 TaxID=2302937 RepID=UPI0013D83032|nr:hypothetical protein [Bacteroides sp. 519]NDV59362.1 hypothetical protein [Bacteroides sp. 519]